MMERTTLAGSVSALASHIARASRITVLTGAGVSAASGIPTFRGVGGLWRQYRAEDLATPDAFRRDPRLVWEWYESRRAMVAGAHPNDSHRVLADWSRHRQCTVITQNVDDLHLRAGTERVIRLHGSLWELRCTGRRLGDGAAAAGSEHRPGPHGPGGIGRRLHGHGSCAEPWRDERVPLEFPPQCPRCGALARPGVVWFGEALGERELAAAAAATRCDLFIAIGTSALVYPAAGLVQEARRAGAVTAEINAEATPASASVDIALTGAAEQILPQLNLLLAR
jgi:NAD-dependent deacetylase sirtuin 5